MTGSPACDIQANHHAFLRPRCAGYLLDYAPYVARYPPVNPIAQWERRMRGILSGMRIVEGSAFVAMPLGGMTLAQLGADVASIRSGRPRLHALASDARWPA